MNLIRWALWSRTRLFAAVGGTLVVMLLLSMAAAALAPARGSAPHHDSASDPTSATSTPTGGRAVGGTPAEQVEATTTAFLNVWMHPKDPVEWADELNRYGTPDMIALAYAVDQTQIPHGHPKQVQVQKVATSAALVRAQLAPKVTVYVGLEHTDQGWRVSTLTGADG